MLIMEYLQTVSTLPVQVVSPDFVSTIVPAYLDPGTGSLIIQALIGVVVGGLVTARIFWKRLTIFFKGLFSGGSVRPKTRD